MRALLGPSAILEKDLGIGGVVNIPSSYCLDIFCNHPQFGKKPSFLNMG